LGVFSQGRGHRLDSWGFHGKEVMLDDGSPDGANVGVATQDRYKVSPAVPAIFNFSNEPVQPKPDSRGGVLHSLGVFENAEAFVGIPHGFLLWDLAVMGILSGWCGSISSVQRLGSAIHDRQFIGKAFFLSDRDCTLFVLFFRLIYYTCGHKYLRILIKCAFM
jgi:hypothetical protein